MYAAFKDTQKCYKKCLLKKKKIQFNTSSASSGRGQANLLSLATRISMINTCVKHNENK